MSSYNTAMADGRQRNGYPPTSPPSKQPGELAGGSRRHTKEMSKLLSQRRQLMSLHDKVRAKSYGKPSASSTTTVDDARGAKGSDVRSSSPIPRKSVASRDDDDEESLDNIEVARLHPSGDTEDILEESRANGALQEVARLYPAGESEGTGEESRAIGALQQVAVSVEDPTSPLALDERASKQSSRSSKKKMAHGRPTSPVVDEWASKSPRKRSNKKAVQGLPTSPVADEWARKSPSKPNKRMTHGRRTSPVVDEGAREPFMNKKSPQGLPKLVLVKTLSSDCVDNTLELTKSSYSHEEMNREEVLSPKAFFHRYGIDYVTDDVIDDVIDDLTNNSMVEPKPFPFTPVIPPTKYTCSGLTESTSIEDTFSMSATAISTPNVASPKQHPLNFFRRMLCAVCKIDDTQNLDDIGPLMLTDTLEFAYPANRKSDEIICRQSSSHFNESTSISSSYVQISSSRDEADDSSSDEGSFSISEDSSRDVYPTSFALTTDASSFGYGETPFL